MAGSDDNWAPPSARAIADDAWQPPSARPLRVFTGKEERAAEAKKLHESLGIDSRIPGVKPVTNALAKLGLGFGGGLYGAHLNLSDLGGRLLGGRVPGFDRVNRNWWEGENELAGPLMNDTMGGLGNLFGQTAAFAPAGIAAGALGTAAGVAALPSAFAGALPVVAGGIDAATVNALMSPGDETEGAQTGVEWGTGIPMAFKLAGLLPRPLRAAARGLANLVVPGVSREARELALKSGAIRFGGTSEGAAERLAELRSAAGKDLSGLVSEMHAGGAQGIPADDLSAALLARGEQLAPNAMSPAAINAYKRTSERILEKAGPRRWIAGESSRTLTLPQGEALKQALQEGIPYGRPGAKAAVNAQKDIASMFREAQEMAVAQAGRQLPELAQLAADYVPKKQTTGYAIEAAKAAAKAAKPGLYGRLGDLMAMGSAASAGMAHHGPAGALWSIPVWAAEHALRTRGPSSAAALGYGLGNLLERTSMGGDFLTTALLGRRLALRPLADEATSTRRRLSDLLLGPTSAEAH